MNNLTAHGQRHLFKKSLVILIFFFTTAFLFSTDVDDVGTESEKEIYTAPYSDLESILQSPDFGTPKKVWDIRLKEFKTEKKENAPETAPWIEKLRNITAFVLRIVLIVSIAVLLFVLSFLILRLKKQIPLKQNKKIQSEKLFSADDNDPESLLKDAESLYSGGFKRGGWVKCNACVIAAFNKRNISFPKDATEFECLYVVRKYIPQFETAFNQFIKSWILAAYSKMPLNDADFACALDFCRSLIFINGKEE